VSVRVVVAIRSAGCPASPAEAVRKTTVNKTGKFKTSFRPITLKISI